MGNGQFGRSRGGACGLREEGCLPRGRCVWYGRLWFFVFSPVEGKMSVPPLWLNRFCPPAAALVLMFLAFAIIPPVLNLRTHLPPQCVA